MTLTMIEYTDGVETSRAEGPDCATVGLFLTQRVEELNLVLEGEVYRNPDGQIVRFVLDHESGLLLLREAIGKVETTEEAQ